MSIEILSKLSGLDSLHLPVGSGYSLIGELLNSTLWLFLSDGDAVYSAKIGPEEVADLRVRLGLPDDLSVFIAIRAALEREKPSLPCSLNKTVPISFPIISDDNSSDCRIELAPVAQPGPIRGRLLALLARWALAAEGALQAQQEQASGHRCNRG